MLPFKQILSDWQHWGSKPESVRYLTISVKGFVLNWLEVFSGGRVVPRSRCRRVGIDPVDRQKK